nr:hypothetical protein [Tanacetum cinerariifolium]
MASLSKDIQCADSDTQPPMLDSTEFASWQQRIRLYFRGKENRVNILKSIDEGPFQMGTVREPLAEGTEGASYFKGYLRTSTLLSIITLMQRTYGTIMQLNSKFVNNMLSEWGRFVTAVKLNRELKDSNNDMLYVYLKQHEGRQNRGQGTNPQGGGAAGYGGVQNIAGNANPDKMLLMQAQENRVALDEEQLLFLAGGQDNAIDEDVDEKPVQDLALNMDNMFQANDCDAFDSDVDEAPMTQTMFMANLSSAYPVYDEAGPSYDLDILSEVHDHDHYQDAVCEHHDEHAMHDNVQLNHVVDSHTNYTSDSNMIPYDQYEKDNTMPVVHSNVSYVPNDAYMMIYNDMYEPHAQSVSKTPQNTIVENSLTTELQHIRNKLNCMKDGLEEVTSLKKDFKQKENKYLEDFLDMKSLKEKVKDRLLKQDQSLQTVHMLCRPNPYYNELNKVAIGYKNPLYLTRAKQVQPDLYNGHKIIKDNHVSAIVHNTEDTLEIAEITRRKMNDKMKDPECVNHKVKIAPHDYLKENLLATFAQQKKHDEIERKNLLITNDNLIAECLSKEVFSVATNFKLNVARFTEMHVANTIVETRCLELEAELSNLRDKSHNDNHDDKMQASLQGKDNVIKKLQKPISHLQEIRSKADRTLNFRALDSQITQLTAKVTALQAQNDMFRAENDKIKKHYKELNIKEAHLDYLRHLKESIETIHDIVEEAKVVRPLHSLIVSACRYAKHSQELLEYAIGTFPQDSHQRDKKLAPAPLIRKKQVTFAEHYDTSNSNTHKHVAKLNTQKTNVPVPHSTRVNRCTDASGSQPRSNTKKNRISPAKGVNKMKVEEQHRINMSHLRTINCVDSSSRSKSTVIYSNSDSVCQTCNKYLISANHDMCVVDYLQSVVLPPIFVVLVMLCPKISKFGNLSKLGKYGNPQEKYLPVLVINGDPQEGYSP